MKMESDGVCRVCCRGGGVKFHKILSRSAVPAVWGRAADCRPYWRKQYGKLLRGIGGMDKRVFAGDYSDVDREVEHLRRLVDRAGICPVPTTALPPTPSGKTCSMMWTKCKI